MNGGEIHEYIVRRLDAEFRANGFRTAQQVPARSGCRLGYIDLVAEDDSGHFVCVEVEMSGRRVPADLVKAARLSRYVSCGRRTDDLCVLWIVVANRRAKEAVSRTLSQMGVSEDKSIWLLTYGQALSRIRNNLSFSSGSMLEEKEKQK